MRPGMSCDLDKKMTAKWSRDYLMGFGHGDPGEYCINAIKPTIIRLICIICYIYKGNIDFDY